MTQKALKKITGQQQQEHKYWEILYAHHCFHSANACRNHIFLPENESL